MKETIVITTDELEPAVRARAAFSAGGYEVELLTAGESLADAVGEPILVILTGGVREARGTDLIREARLGAASPSSGCSSRPTRPAGTRAGCSASANAA